MADDEAQTKTGGTEMTGGTGVTGGTGTTGTTGGTGALERAKPDQPKTDPQTPKTDPQEEGLDKNNNNNVDVEAQQMKTGVLADDYGVGIKTFDCEIARKLFVQKVFGMVGAMLAVVAFMTLLPFVSQNFRIFAFRNQWLHWVAYVFYLITYLSLVCCQCTRRKKPLNYIMTGILVFSMGWMTIGITIHADTEIVLIALVMTTLCCAATIIFAMKTKFDITQCGPIFCLLGIVMFIFGIVAIIAALAFKVYWVYTVYAGLMTLLLMAYLAYDVQMLIGGKRQEISVNDPFYAAVQIFVDIVMMFWYMVQFIQGIKS